MEDYSSLARIATALEVRNLLLYANNAREYDAEVRIALAKAKSLMGIKYLNKEYRWWETK